MKGRQGRCKRGLKVGEREEKDGRERKSEQREQKSKFKKTSRSDQQSCQQAAGRQKSEIVTALFLQKLNIMLGGAAEPLLSGRKQFVLSDSQKIRLFCSDAAQG